MISRVLLKDYLAHRRSINEEAEFINSEFHDDISPLMLSAMCDSYELVKLFHDRGYVLHKPDPYTYRNVEKMDTTTE